MLRAEAPAGARPCTRTYGRRVEVPEGVPAPGPDVPDESLPGQEGQAGHEPGGGQDAQARGACCAEEPQDGSAAVQADDAGSADVPPEKRDAALGELPDDERPADALTNAELGKRGEDAAARYLRLNGYEILERNWTCRFGEADIIARDEEGVLCFVEVKTRRSIEAGIPEEAVTPDKQRRYEKVALCYLVESDCDDGMGVRFDAIGICVTGNRRALLRHHKGCFDGLF